MTTRSRAVARPVALVVAGLLPLALTACGASRDAQTYQERSQADATNTAVGALALRGLSVLPPRTGGALEPGSDAEAVLTVTNSGQDPDSLLEVTTPAASSVEVLASNRPATLRVPALGSTGNAITLRLVGLTSQLREGEYVTMTFRFEKNGTIEVPVPVAVSGRTDRPVYTGEEGGEGEPALQAPAGGHGEEHDEAEEAGQEGEEGVVDSAEEGASEGDTAGATDEESEGASTTDGAEPASSPAG